MIERHLRLPGVECQDAAFSLTPPQMDEYINQVMAYVAETAQVPHLAEAAAS